MMEALLYSAIAPFGLLLLSGIWQYPPVLEEVVKWGIIKNSEPRSGLMVGLVFGLSEAVLYTANAWQSGEWETIILRLALTVPMHAVSSAVTGWGISRGKQYFGLFVAMVIHFGFNYIMR